MIDTTYIINLIKLHAKKIIAFVVLSTIVGGVTALLLPKQYASSSIVMPANPKLTDKNYLYGQGTLELSSAYGMEEDADRLLTQLRLSSNFSKLVDSFQLVDHYKIKPSDKAKAIAQEELVQNSYIAKIETGAIKISFWDKDKNVSAALANAMVALTEQKANDNNQTTNQNYLQQLQNNIATVEKELQAADTIQNNVVKETTKKAVQASLEKNLTALQQLKLSTASNPPNIIVLEKAYASQKADKPRLRYWLVASFMASLLFALVAVVLLDTLKKK